MVKCGQKKCGFWPQKRGREKGAAKKGSHKRFGAFHGLVSDRENPPTQEKAGTRPGRARPGLLPGGWSGSWSGRAQVKRLAPMFIPTLRRVVMNMGATPYRGGCPGYRPILKEGKISPPLTGANTEKNRIFGGVDTLYRLSLALFFLPLRLFLVFFLLVFDITIL